MTPVNPHWDLTDQPAATKPNARTLGPDLALAVPRGSPRPAAILGVLLAVAVGVYGASLTSGLSLRGQTASQTIVVISSSGFSPANITVSVGQNVALRNADTIAHTVELPNPIAGRPALFSVTLDPRRAQNVPITSDIPPGAYTIVTTDPIPLVASLQINPAPAGDSVFNAPSAPASSDNDAPAVTNSPLSSGIQPSATTDAASGRDDGTAFTIELNPYTVGTTRPSAPVTPVTAESITLSAPSLIQPVGLGGTTFRPGAPRAPSVPRSGPEMWIISAIALASFWLVVRRSWRAA